MRIVRYRGTDGPAWGVLGDDDRVRATTGTPFDNLAAGNDAGALSDLELLAPAMPSKVICVGRNYREHAAEFNNPVPEEPLLFMKPPSSVIGPGAEI
ncbi:MAG: Rv2993c-like domain-containing protein, partial [Candidatus Limnocylindria bacterium]